MNSLPVDEQQSHYAARMQSIGYARAAGTGLGIFYLGWAVPSFLRWGDYGPTALFAAEAVFLFLFGLFMAAPWRWIRSAKLWHYCFIFFVFLGCLFPFIIVVETLFQHVLAAQIEAKPPSPGFPGLQLFIGLMQLPAVLFLRRPELLD